MKIVSSRTLFIRRTNEQTFAFTGLLDGAKKCENHTSFLAIFELDFETVQENFYVRFLHILNPLPLLFLLNQICFSNSQNIFVLKNCVEKELKVILLRADSKDSI